jgi:hypothetical protein
MRDTVATYGIILLVLIVLGVISNKMGCEPSDWRNEGLEYPARR